MNSEEAMKQVDQIIDDYIEDKISEFTALARIARISGRWEWSKP